MNIGDGFVAIVRGQVNRFAEATERLEHYLGRLEAMRNSGRVLPIEVATHIDNAAFAQSAAQRGIAACSEDTQRAVTDLTSQLWRTSCAESERAVLNYRASVDSLGVRCLTLEVGTEATSRSD